MHPFLEKVPVADDSWRPCDEADDTGIEAQHRLSCMAEEHEVYIVANMGSIDLCMDDTPGCPTDGRFQYNTNVVYDPTGLFIAR